MNPFPPNIDKSGFRIKVIRPRPRGKYQVGSIVKLTENNDWEMTVPKNNSRKPVINGQPLFSLRNNVPEGSGR